MHSFGEALRQSREAAGLQLPEFSRLSGLPEDRLSAWEGGQPADPVSMDRCALVMGVPLKDFLKGEGARTDFALLFRKSNAPELEGGREQLLALDAGLGLSRFCRVVYHLRDLRQLLGIPAPSLPELSKQYEARPQEESPGDHLARAARRALAIGPTEPIHSMRKLLESLGIPLVISAQGEVDPRVTGASALHPLPSTLLVPAWSTPWATRMTLAHELCHLLFHGTGFSVSSDTSEVMPRTWKLDADYLEREQEASAFAAAFLAPSYAVQQLLQGIKKPDSEQGIRKVGSHFKVGKQVAVNRIVDIFRLSETRRQALLGMDVRRWSASGEDTVREEEMGLLQGPVRALALEALANGRISKTRVRSILGLPDTEPLEGGDLDDQLRAPVLPREQAVARQCQFELLRKGVMVIAEEAEETETGFHVRLTNPEGQKIGYATVDREGHLLAEPAFE